MTSYVLRCACSKRFLHDDGGLQQGILPMKLPSIDLNNTDAAGGAASMIFVCDSSISAAYVNLRNKDYTYILPAAAAATQQRRTMLLIARFLLHWSRYHTADYFDITRSGRTRSIIEAMPFTRFHFSAFAIAGPMLGIDLSRNIDGGLLAGGAGMAGMDSMPPLITYEGL